MSWEAADRTQSGLPGLIDKLLRENGYDKPVLLVAVAEHKVELEGTGHASQCDVWAIVDTSLGALSLTVEAKAREPFGDKTLTQWLENGRSAEAQRNRECRWAYISEYLPVNGGYGEVRYQLLHRCAAAVIEAKNSNCGMRHSSFKPSRSQREVVRIRPTLRITPPFAAQSMCLLTAAEWRRPRLTRLPLTSGGRLRLRDGRDHCRDQLGD